MARLSTEYVACFLSEGVADTGLDLIDFAIAVVVSASNIGQVKDRLAGDGPWADAPIPPHQMTPVSRTNIAESLKLPLGVAEARIDALIERGVLLEAAGGVCIGEPITNSNTAGRMAEKNLAMAGRFARQLADVGLGV